MEESAGSFVSVDTGNELMMDFEFKPLEKEEYYLDEIVKLYFRLPDPHRCPSYLDVIRFTPLLETLRQKKQTSGHELTLSYCRWNIENGDGQFSVIVKVEDIVATNDNFRNAEEGIVYVVHYVSSPNNKVIAESTPFRLYPVLEESTMNLPEVFSDDGLIVLGSGSDSEPELLDDETTKDDPDEKAEKSSGDVATSIFFLGIPGCWRLRTLATTLAVGPAPPSDSALRTKSSRPRSLPSTYGTSSSFRLGFAQ